LNAFIEWGCAIILALPPLLNSGAKMDLTQWLAELGLGQYAAAFAENDIDFDVLAQLTDADLKELGVSSLGNRKRLLAAIAARVPVSAISVSHEEISKGERRQVTIVFADLCEFTPLSQSLDPEEVRELVARYTALVDGIVVSYGGTIDKHIGDAVMALFGAPKSHDDDPLRAARAALDIHEALGRLTDSRRRPLQAHVGIASGEVVAGSLQRGSAHDYTVLGDSVNLAARLVAAAGPGQTLLSNTVYRALAGRGLCDDLGAIELKGFDVPARVWRLRGISPDPPAANRTAFVGRKAELDQFKSLITACLARRTGQVVYLRGEAGIGKTRLVEEMRRFSETSGFATHRGLVLDFGVAKGHDPVRAILLSLLGLLPGSEAEPRQALAERLFAERVVAPDNAAFLHDLLELPQTTQQRALYDAMDVVARERGKRALAAALIAHCSRGQPTLLIVEDLHWADPQILAYLASFATAVSGIPGFLVMTSRVEGDQLDAAWRASCRGTPFATIDLGPLRGDEALSLVGNFIDATHSVASACTERAGGNPLFLEQLLRNAQEGCRDAIPASIQSLVQARMDRLSARDRDAFQIAAVIGQRFDLGLLRHLMAAPDYSCANLIANALAIPEGDDFMFAHALIQEGAYSSMLRSRRRELHARAAEWYSERDLTLCAQHFDRADDERAAKAYLRAAVAQRSTYHMDAAFRLAARGCEIARDAADRHALICLKGELQRDLGDPSASVLSYREAIEASPDDIARCRAQIGLAEGLRVTEGLSEALHLLGQAQQVAEKHELTADLARLHHLRGNIYFPLGNIDGCRDEHERGFVHARQLESPEAKARALGGLADAAYAQGRMHSAFEYFSQCVSLCRQHGFGKIEVANRSMIGASRIYLNEVQQAREDGDAAARAASLVGQPRAELLGEIVGVFATYELGDFASMEGYLTRKMQLARQLGARRFEAQALEMKARVLLDTGQRKEAADLLQEALAICREVGTQFCGPKVASALARAVEDAKTRAAVLAEGQEMLGRGAVGHNHLWFYRDAIEALLSARDGAGALTYVTALENYTRAEPLPWSDLFAKRGRFLAKALHCIDEDIRAELTDVRSSLERAGFRSFLPPVNAALDG
jgi:class 3 adenylate cyclase/tetratricopeptide (TPR) repeat protein